MDKATFTERMQAIGTEEDEANRRDMIAQLIEDAGNDYDDHAAAVTDRDNALQQVEHLQQRNKELFMRIPVRNEPNPQPAHEPEEKPKYSDLFNERGELK